ncbi:3810_t:CDS:2, partial [Funneliformis mosseae]
ITLTTFRTIVTRLEIHQAFTLDASNATPALKQIAIILWRKWNWITTRNKPRIFKEVKEITQALITQLIVILEHHFNHWPITLRDALEERP